MPGTLVRRRSRSVGWARRAGAAVSVARGVWRGVKRVRSAISRGRSLARSTSRTRSKSRPKSSTRPSSAAPMSVDPQSISHGSVSLRLASPVKGMKSLGRWVYTQQNNGRIVAGLGLQGAGVLLGHNTISQLVVDTAVPNGTQFKDDVFAMNPYQANTGSGIFGSILAPSQDRIMCRSVRTKFMMANTSNAPCVVVLYWVLSKKAHQGNPFDRWTSFLSETALGQSTATQPNQSDSSTGPGTTGVPTFAVYGQEPTTVRSWRNTFKLLRRKEYHMSFGAVQCINYSVAVNKMFDKTVATQHNTLTSTGYPGGTVWLCAVVRGTRDLVPDCW
ncbi:putative capsid protein [Scythevirus monetis]|uniref:Putative capsid protein n=1 Tax=Palaemonetes kadiakensis Mississippi grass shrimp associated circular virus TaxID=1692258 RepID=A0A0K1RL61_9CIRC|nr:putative capsid protein [Palaemonetes kadiakensis Mississippi grass shrimp associated circular virus]AKV62286.1 putative capsid protein [Palaemonetes kadiakensis Mississippi grass shrimp associated circular virus]